MPQLRRAAILGHNLDDLGQKLSRHMQLLWCSSKIYRAVIRRLL